MKLNITPAMVKKEQQNYFKKWRENNKDKVKQNNQKYWENRVIKRVNKSLKGK